MKKTTLFLSILFITASISAQRISELTIEGKTSLVPFGAFNPKDNKADQPGDGQIIYPEGTDLSNVNVQLNFGTDATLDAPTSWPTDWTNTVTGIKITNKADHPTKPNTWAMYNLTIKTVKPAPLPLEIKTGTGNFDSDSWTTSTVGWAGAAIDKGQSVIRFGSSKRSFVVAFNSAPDSLVYTIKFLGSPWNTDNIFDIDGSADGINWTSIMQYNATNPMPLSSPTEISKFKLSSAFRYIRWVYTNRAGTNVALENILVTKGTESSVLSIAEQGVKLYSVGSKSLRLENFEEVKSVRIYSISGALVLEAVSPSSTIEFREHDKGVYLAEIKFKSGNIKNTKLLR